MDIISGVRLVALRQLFLLLLGFSFLPLCYALDEHEIHETFLSAWIDRFDRYHALINTESRAFYSGYSNAASSSISRRQFIHELPQWLEQTKRSHIVKGKSFVLDRFTRMMHARPDSVSVANWFEQIVKSTIEEAYSAISTADRFVSMIERTISNDPHWMKQLERIPAFAGTAIGKLDELLTLYTEVMAYYSDMGRSSILNRQDELAGEIRRSRVGLINMDYQRWLIFALNRPGACFYLQGIRTCQ